MSWWISSKISPKWVIHSSWYEFITLPKMYLVNVLHSAQLTDYSTSDIILNTSRKEKGEIVALLRSCTYYCNEFCTIFYMSLEFVWTDLHMRIWHFIHTTTTKLLPLQISLPLWKVVAPVFHYHSYKGIHKTVSDGYINLHIIYNNPCVIFPMYNKL